MTSNDTILYGVEFPEEINKRPIPSIPSQMEQILLRHEIEMSLPATQAYIRLQEQTDIVFEQYLKEFKVIKDHEITLIKYGSYYKLQLIIELDSKLNLRRITTLENKIKRGIIRHRSLKVKHVTIYVTNDLD